MDSSPAAEGVSAREGALPSAPLVPPVPPTVATERRHGGLASRYRRRAAAAADDVEGSAPSGSPDPATDSAAATAAAPTVRFADVHIREFERVPLEPGIDGAPRVGLGWTPRKDILRRLDSLEREVRELACAHVLVKAICLEE